MLNVATISQLGTAIEDTMRMTPSTMTAKGEIRRNSAAKLPMS
jgi:hypothetical protein